ncbi:MAG: hypothetical protein HOE90_13785 [Bacteriovoracaceae bacterium]|nr:hypothetical protein [Bacteriovoracaceae bacterium]
MSAKDNSAMTYFRFQKELGYNIYLKLDTRSYSDEFLDFIAKHQFSMVDEKDNKSVEAAILEDRKARVLKITPANFSVLRKLGSHKPEDRFGRESTTNGSGYSVYRYKGVALVVYSTFVKEWELGVVHQFGTGDLKGPSSVVINRFLSWALGLHGVVGFWGVPVDEGVVVMKEKASGGEAVFLDFNKKQLLTIDGAKDFNFGLNILKLAQLGKEEGIQMKLEELIPFLVSHCTYFDYDGIPLKIRQMIIAISRTATGFVYHQSSFKPRSEEVAS